MEQFKTLTSFVEYCESIAEESNEFWLLSSLAANLTKEELLDDMKDCLEVYFKWTHVAVEEEMYLCAGLIWSAMEHEMDHYEQLGRALYKVSIKKDINKITKDLKMKYL